MPPLLSSAAACQVTACQFAAHVRCWVQEVANGYSLSVCSIVCISKGAKVLLHAFTEHLVLRCVDSQSCSQRHACLDEAASALCCQKWSTRAG